MTAIVLNLKIRPNRLTINIPIEIARQHTNGSMPSLEDEEALRIYHSRRDQFFAQIKVLTDANGPTHDRFWLELICNWTPQEGLPLVAQAPWIKLAMRVADLDDSREGEFHLSEMDVERIWRRLTDPDFRVRRDAAFDGFLVDWIEATGRDFPDE